MLSPKLTKPWLRLNLTGQHRAGLRLAMISLILAGFAVADFSATSSVQAEKFASPAFEKYWSRVDQPVANQVVQRGYVWGSQPFFNSYEEYQESPNGRRQVQYFDKTRMEINRPAPDGNPESPFYVTNGLITKELILGTVQTGDNRFSSRMPAFDIPIAGDPIEVNPDAPTYASFFNLSAAMLPSSLSSLPNPVPCNSNSGTACDSNIRTNEGVVDVINKEGSLSRNTALGTFRGARYVYYDRTLKHNVPQIFWDYLNQSGIVYEDGNYTTKPLFNWISTFGYPITDAYWMNTRVSGVMKTILVQIFERRTLTFNPDNQPGYQVEMGNVGRHYYQWRYSPRYDISTPACAFCNVTPQAAFPGATFVIRTEPIFLFLGAPENISVTILQPNGKILTAADLPNFTGQSDLGIVRLAITTSTRFQRGLYTVIITGQTSTQQAKAFFSIIDIPGVALNYAPPQ